MDLVLDTENATVTATDTVMFYVPAGAQVRVDDVGIEDASHTTTSTLGYNAANELTSMTDGSATINFTYDPWGRMVSKYQAQTYSASYGYRYGDKLYSVTSTFPNEGAVTYQYGGDAKRRSRVQGTTESWYNWDGLANILNEENDADGTGLLVWTYIIDDPMADTIVGESLAEIAGSNPSTGTWQYYFLDHLGSTRRLHAQDKSTIGYYEYSPYGDIYFRVGTSAKSGFAGRQWDATTGFYYYPYRYYSPSAARWFVHDPEYDGTNLYAYTDADPVNYIDVLGSWKTKLHGRYAFYDEWYPPADHTRAHFRGGLTTSREVNFAIGNCDGLDFLKAMHRRQDYWAHRKVGWNLIHPPFLVDNPKLPWNRNRFQEMQDETGENEQTWTDVCGNEYKSVHGHFLPEITDFLPPYGSSQPSHHLRERDAADD
jgi:RHS repeat-associated protein